MVYRADWNHCLWDCELWIIQKQEIWLFYNGLGYSEINLFTLTAAFVEIPAIILSVYLIHKQVWLEVE